MALSEADRERLDEIVALARSHGLKIGAGFYDAIATIREQIDLDELAAAAATAFPGRVQAVLDDAVARAGYGALTSAVQAAVMAGAGIAAGEASAVLPGRLAVYFDVVNPKVADFLNGYKMDLITRLTAEARANVRASLTEGIIAGRGPLDVARNVRASIGLTPQLARAASNYRRALEAGEADNSRALRDRRFDRSVARTGTLAQDRIDRIVDRYEERALRYRSETIARTEAARAVEAGKLATWEQAIADGKVERENVRRFWIYTHDGKTRPWHRTIPALNRQGVGIDEPFRSEHGEIMFPGDPHAAADNTINCRCTTFVRYMPTLRKFDESQHPRVPAGRPTGGRWTVGDYTFATDDHEDRGSGPHHDRVAPELYVPHAAGSPGRTLWTMRHNPTGKLHGYAEVGRDSRGSFVDLVHVARSERRKGLARAFYDHLERVAGPVHPSDTQLADGKALWEGIRPGALAAEAKARAATDLREMTDKLMGAKVTHPRLGEGTVHRVYAETLEGRFSSRRGGGYVDEDVPPAEVARLRAHHLAKRDAERVYAIAKAEARPVTKAGWDERQHPRVPAGNPEGGEFTVTQTVPGQYDVHVGGKFAGSASLATDWGKGGHKPFISAISLEPQFRRRGIGSAVYAKIERDLGRHLVPSPLGLTEQATEFWRKRLAGHSPSERSSILAEAREIGLSYGIKPEHIDERLAPLVEHVRKFDESQHPRKPAGTPDGGQWVDTGAPEWPSPHPYGSPEYNAALAASQAYWQARFKHEEDTVERRLADGAVAGKFPVIGTISDRHHDKLAGAVSRGGPTLDNDYYSAASERARRAVERYTGDGGRTNHGIRQGAPNEAVPELDKLVAHGRLPWNVELFRGINASGPPGAAEHAASFDKLTPGDVIRDPAFISTSLHREIFDTRASDVKLRIQAEAGTPAFMPGSYGTEQTQREREVILGRDVPLRYIGREGDEHVFRVDQGAVAKSASYYIADLDRGELRASSASIHTRAPHLSGLSGE